MPILGRSNYFQLYNLGHADFALAVNAGRMDAGERFLWHNVEVMLKIIKEAGLEDKLQEAYEQNIKDYAQIENERYARHHSQIQEDQQMRHQMNINVVKALSE